jgi:hypothetical protein
MAKEVRNIGASVRARLLNLSRETGQNYNLLLTRYALERLLHRLTQTPHHDRFVLKGAMLMTTWFDDPYRPTRDVDLLGFGDPEPQAMLEVFREVCSVEANDGVEFDRDRLEVTANREDLAMAGFASRPTPPSAAPEAGWSSTSASATPWNLGWRSFSSRSFLTSRPRSFAPMRARRSSPRSFRRW